MLNAITGEKIHLYDFLKEEIKAADEIKIIVSFLMESGIKLIIRDLKKQALKGTDIKIITGKYLGITEPSALYLLKDELGDLVDLRFYKHNEVSFHPKAYFFKSNQRKTLIIGSSNLSHSALTSGIEWNYRILNEKDQESYNQFEEEFNKIFLNDTIKVSATQLREYASNWRKNKIFDVDNATIVDEPSIPEPRGAQIEALYELKLAREEGVKKGMVIAATGVGKTYLAAFDSIDFEKVLFIAHREEILKQANASYMNINPKLKTSFFTGKEKDKTGDVIFSSVQTLGSEAYLNKDYFKPNDFDYIIIDEFHHAAADSYRRILNFFKPDFLLGLTATPYRMDNKDIYELCNDNVIYEIDLKNAINRDLLVPFKYFGIYDTEVDYDSVKHTNGKYNIIDLEAKLSTHKRADLVLKNYKNLAGNRTLGFCASIGHAKFMTKFFNEYKIKAVCVHSSPDKSEYFMERDKAIKQLENGEIDIIFAVDIFNEGVDIPSLDTVLFLRPTESYVIFLQQLGRGLRKFINKEYLKVIDFIGNYKRAHYIPYLLSGKNPLAEEDKDFKNMDEFDYPDDCLISFDFKVIDLFNELRANDPLQKRMEDEYFRLKRYLNNRPMRKDIYDGIDINTREYLRRSYNDQKGYLRFLDSINELKDNEKMWLNTIVEEFLIELEGTSMTKSYKMPTLQSLVVDGKLKEKVSIDKVGESFMNFYKNNKLHQKDLNNKKHKKWREWPKDRFTKEAVKNPVNFLCKRKFFIHDEINNVFMLNKELHQYIDKDLTNHFLDIIEYRKTRYFERRFKK